MRRFFIVLWRQLPFYLWLVVLWALLWGQFSVLTVVSGIVVAIGVKQVFRLPFAQSSRRVNLWYTAVFIVTLIATIVRATVVLSGHILMFGSQPRNAVVSVPLRTHSELMMTHVAITCSLIPGSLVLDADPETFVLSMHVLGTARSVDAQAQREQVLLWEKRLVRAFGSRGDLKALRARAVVGSERA